MAALCTSKTTAAVLEKTATIFFKSSKTGMVRNQPSGTGSRKGEAPEWSRWNSSRSAQPRRWTLARVAAGRLLPRQAVWREARLQPRDPIDRLAGWGRAWYLLNSTRSKRSRCGAAG